MSDLPSGPELLRYRILDIIGTGAFGVVYRAFDEDWKQEVALKSLLQVTPLDRQQLKAEYRALRDIRHPGLVRLHELHVDDTHCFFTMDLVRDGLPFNERLTFDRQNPAARSDAVFRICRAATRLAEAVHSVHTAGKCHRDLKPSNILMTPDDHVVVLDFGLSSPFRRSNVLDTRRGFIMGTLAYLAPEQLLDTSPLPASDWYSFGVVLYEALVGALPFDDEAQRKAYDKSRRPPLASSIVPGVPDALDELIVCLLSTEPSNRPLGDAVLQTLQDVAPERPAPNAWGWSDLSDEHFVGRDRELDALLSADASCRSGQFVLSEIVGPSGIGKTALVRNFIRGLGDPAPLVLEARCHPHEAIPYNAFDAAVDDVARYWLGTGEVDARVLCPGGELEALACIFPDLRRVPACAVPPSPFLHRGDPRVLRERAFDSLRRVLSALSARTNVVLWIDDAQWSDQESIALIESVFAADDPPRIHFVVSRRPESETVHPRLHAALARAHSKGASGRIELAPLPLDSALALARAISPESAEEEMAPALKETAGIPYLISELAYFAAEKGGWRDVLGVSKTATTLMAERMASLPESDRTLVELAALAEKPVRADVLLAAADEGDHGRLGDLCVFRLLRWHAGQQESVQIYHDRLREFVTRSLDEPRGRALRRRLLDAMERVGSDDAERMMEHAFLCGDGDAAMRHATVAAQRAFDALAFEQAVRLFRVVLDTMPEGAPRGDIATQLAEALANSGQSTEAAPAFEAAWAFLKEEQPSEREPQRRLRRRAGEQYLKAGHFEDGLRLMKSFLADEKVFLPQTGRGALLISASRRTRLYLRGFDIASKSSEEVAASVTSRLEHLFQVALAFSMMDPVRADGIGLLHCHESLRSGHVLHSIYSLALECAYASLFGFSRTARKCKDRSQRELSHPAATPYARAFHLLGEGNYSFFHSRWDDAAGFCDSAAEGFRKLCRGAEYEAAVAVVFSLQALGLAGKVSQLVARIPEAIRDADARGDIFAANNYRGGFHAVARIAAGQVDEVMADIERVVETWNPGLYQMHAYHRLFAKVAADLYVGRADDALQLIEEDWPALKAGLFLQMTMPAVELKWTFARASIGAARHRSAKARRGLVQRARRLAGSLQRSKVPAARPHASLIRAGLFAIEDRSDRVQAELESALRGYECANMAIHREVSRWCLGRLVEGDQGRDHLHRAEAWMSAEGVSDMGRLAAAIAPGLETNLDGP